MWERSAAALDLGPPRQERRQRKHFFSSLEEEGVGRVHFQRNIFFSHLWSCLHVLFVSAISLKIPKSTQKSLSLLILVPSTWLFFFFVADQKKRCFGVSLRWRYAACRVRNFPVGEKSSTAHPPLLLLLLLLLLPTHSPPPLALAFVQAVSARRKSAACVDEARRMRRLQDPRMRWKGSCTELFEHEMEIKKSVRRVVHPKSIWIWAFSLFFFPGFM